MIDYYRNIPSFDFELQTDHQIVISDTSDLNGGITITNGVEIVVKVLHDKDILRDKKLFYRDTDGAIDEIVHDGNGNFIKFKPFSRQK